MPKVGAEARDEGLRLEECRIKRPWCGKAGHVIRKSFHLVDVEDREETQEVVLLFFTRFGFLLRFSREDDWCLVLPFSHVSAQVLRLVDREPRRASISVGEHRLPQEKHIDANTTPFTQLIWKRWITTKQD